MRQILVLVLLSINLIIAQNLQTPLEMNGFTKLTSNAELVSWLKGLQDKFPEITIRMEDTTTLGRKIPYVYLRSNEKDAKKKIKIMFFAQQHGDEPSGKEGMLLLIKHILINRKDSVLEKADILIVPQVNPDGAEVHRRRNENKVDLNRNHLILTENETLMLHRLYNEFMPDVNVDVHEYSPYSENWIKYGYRKDFDEQVGCLTNPNIENALKKFSKERVLPYLKEKIEASGYSFHEYIVGGPPEIERLRFSTTDINDGRQGLGLLGSLGFIIEGKNGLDSMHNIERRAKGQFTAAYSLLLFAIENSYTIKSLVAKSRERLNEIPGSEIALSYEHVENGQALQLPLLSLYTNKDTVITVKAYHPRVETLSRVRAPKAYLVPKSDDKLMTFLKKHTIEFQDYEGGGGNIFEYTITKIDTAYNEEEYWVNPELEKNNITAPAGNYVIVPVKGIHSLALILALEPGSMMGLARYPMYAYLLAKTGKYPVLRLE